MARKLPPFAALRAFEAAARRGQLQEVADEPHVSASAVSHRVRALATFLGAKLFTRDEREPPLALTVDARVHALSRRKPVTAWPCPGARMLGVGTLAAPSPEPIATRAAYWLVAPARAAGLRPVQQLLAWAMSACAGMRAARRARSAGYSTKVSGIDATRCTRSCAPPFTAEWWARVSVK